MNDDEEQVIIIDGGTVTCVEGTRVWARFVEDDREVLILIKYATTTPKLR